VTTYGEMRENLVLQPVSGKALPVYKGEVLRIIQEVGGQCVDFNCFNLHDYKEHMSVGHMRRQGFRIAKGNYVLSNPPRSNLMMLILEMADTCVTDLLGSRCSPEFFESTWGLEKHTNCQDTLAESIGEYGLTPDDVHDSFNMWMNTGWNDLGRFTVRRNSGKKGDRVDLLAFMDVLAVPIVCGSGDVQITSNFFLKPIRIQVFRSSPETDALVQEYLNRFNKYKNQRSLKDFRVNEIRIERELKPDPNYKPHFVNFPLQTKRIAVELSAADYKQVKSLQERGLAEDDEDAIRSAVMAWFVRNRTEPNPFTVPM
jgi:uncharacterized protein